MKTILHCDLNNFFASVECLADPHLKEIPVAVCGDPKTRHGIILAKNELAKKAGIKTAETVWQAIKKCPELTLLPAHYDRYLEYSRQVKLIYLRFTDRIEGFGLDEAWLDVTGSQNLFGTGIEIADQIRGLVRTETGLTISVGVSFTKVFAKLGSDLKKPDATSVISRENFRQVAWRLPVSDLLYVGKSTAERLARDHIVTIGDLANADRNLILQQFGKNGLKMLESALGKDDDEVMSYYENRPIKSVGHGTTLLRDLANFSEARPVLSYLAELVATRLRRYHLQGCTISLSVRDSSLLSSTRQCTLNYPTSLAQEIGNNAFELLKGNYSPAVHPIRTLTITVGNLISIQADSQMSLLNDEKREKTTRLENSIDQIRQKYGYTAVTRANLIDNTFIADSRLDEDEDLLPFKHT